MTHGELNEARDNAVLVLPSVKGTHTRHDFLIGPGLALDQERHVIIAADAIGNGVAISPSNSETQPGMDGDYHKALRSIQARALLMPATKDLLHPPDNSREAARYIPDARLVEITSDLGHLGGGGIAPADIEFVNREIRRFLEPLGAR